jgi:hypothetical protein
MTTTLSPIDQDALTRALVIARAESVQEREHLDGIEARSGWQEAAESAAYHLQCKTLRLKPWHAPPMHCRSDEVGVGYGCSRIEVMLRRRMLKAGLSLFEPNPVAALEAVEAKGVVAKKQPRKITAEARDAPDARAAVVALPSRTTD